MVLISSTLLTAGAVALLLSLVLSGALGAMWELDPANPRLDALFRLLLLVVWVPFIWPFVTIIGLIGGVVFFLGDFIKQLIWGSDGWTAGGGGGWLETWSARLFHWPRAQLEYIIGTDPTGFPVLP